MFGRKARKREKEKEKLAYVHKFSLHRKKEEKKKEEEKKKKFSLHRSMHRSLLLQAHTFIIYQHWHYECLQLTPVFHFIIIIITVIIFMSCFKLIILVVSSFQS